jgi:hypothetical protein
MLSVLAIDPGPVKSAWVHLREGGVAGFGLEANHVVRRVCEDAQVYADGVAIEMIASYGMAVGAEVFETCVWIGRFMESLTRCNIPESRIHRLPRMAIKSHLCHSAKATDANIRQALIDRYGPGKEKAIGNKANPGPLYHIKADIWAALGVAVTLWDAHKPAGYRTIA